MAVFAPPGNQIVPDVYIPSDTESSDSSHKDLPFSLKDAEIQSRLGVLDDSDILFHGIDDADIQSGASEDKDIFTDDSSSSGELDTQKLKKLSKKAAAKQRRSERRALRQSATHQRNVLFHHRKFLLQSAF